MSYMNVGVFINCQPCKTKAALKRAMSESPIDVSFYNTSPFDGNVRFTGNELPAGTTLSVCGPDPQNNRKWYASVSPTGKVS